MQMINVFTYLKLRTRSVLYYLIMRLILTVLVCVMFFFSDPLNTDFYWSNVASKFHFGSDEVNLQLPFLVINSIHGKAIMRFELVSLIFSL